MSGGSVPWAERAADRSPIVARSRARSIEQAAVIVETAQRLIDRTDGTFTTQELAKEAGVALQTFYRYFASKDELLLAVIEELIGDFCETMRERGAELDDPLDRLHLYLTSSLESLAAGGTNGARFITAEHYRLHQLFPDELAAATDAFTDLLIPEIQAAADAGQLAPADLAYDAWLVNQLVLSTFHHYTYATPTEPLDVIVDRLWAFCLKALGGSPT
jgi:AcrR family transcriptional regulator